ncbi:MAG TPA: SxtJ family membrane protein [Gemmataceae bacterium]|jgi:hypothetical protein|nr:SxtJ family membrane protein [Gemmataceae bacterium]
MLWSDIDFHPPERKLRTFAGLFFTAVTVLAGWQVLSHERWLIASLLFVIGGIVATAGLVKPSAIRPVYAASMAASFPMGWVMSHLLLAIVYFGLFTPLAIFFRLIGRDALRLSSEPKAGSYLKPKSPPSNSRSYFRPF